MTRLADKDPIYAELYEAITHFYGRQQLVIRAIMDLGIEPATMRGASAWREKVEQHGAWAKEWSFFFHGGGCELTHQETGEPINWEGPDPAAFSIASFIRHLDWRLAHESRLRRLRSVITEKGEKAIREMIEGLIADGIITPERHLNSAAAISSASGI